MADIEDIKRGMDSLQDAFMKLHSDGISYIDAVNAMSNLTMQLILNSFDPEKGAIPDLIDKWTSEINQHMKMVYEQNRSGTN